MEIFTLLEELEDILENCKTVPFSGKSVVDKEEILEIIKEIRLKLPDELKQAKWIKEERQRILVEAQKEADDIVKEAENRIISMINENEITKKAYEKKAEIIETAKDMEYFPLTSNQMGIYYECLQTEKIKYTMPFAIRFKSSVDPNKLKDAVIKTVDAHPYLKTRIINMDGGKIFQKRCDDAEIEEIEIPLFRNYNV